MPHLAAEWLEASPASSSRDGGRPHRSSIWRKRASLGQCSRSSPDKKGPIRRLGYSAGPPHHHEWRNGLGLGPATPCSRLWLFRALDRKEAGLPGPVELLALQPRAG